MSGVIFGPVDVWRIVAIVAVLVGFTAITLTVVALAFVVGLVGPAEVRRHWRRKDTA